MKTIAILFPGDMGGALARILAEDGFRVVSYLAGRSERTRQSAEAAGVLPLESWKQLALESDVVISLVPPSAVIQVAEAYALAAIASGSKATFVDANAKTPDVATEVAGIIAGTEAPFVNAAVIGGSASLREHGKIFTSGPEAWRLEEILKNSLAVKNLGPEVEKVSAFKMAFAGFNKTLAAALFETAITANAFDIFDPLFEEIQQAAYWKSFSRGVSGYPRHLARRREEMEELSSMLKARDLPHGIASGAESTFQAILDGGLLPLEAGKEPAVEILKRLKFRA